MLNNEKFVSKAPEAKVQEEREKLEKYQQMLAQVQERLAGLKEKNVSKVIELKKLHFKLHLKKPKKPDIKGTI